MKRNTFLKVLNLFIIALIALGIVTHVDAINETANAEETTEVTTISLKPMEKAKAATLIQTIDLGDVKQGESLKGTLPDGVAGHLKTTNHTYTITPNKYGKLTTGVRITGAGKEFYKMLDFWTGDVGVHRVDFHYYNAKGEDFYIRYTYNVKLVPEYRDLGNVEKNSVKKITLPDKFQSSGLTVTTGNAKVECALGSNVYQATLGTASLGKNEVRIVLRNDNSMYDGSNIVYRYNVVTKSTTGGTSGGGTTVTNKDTERPTVTHFTEVEKGTSNTTLVINAKDNCCIKRIAVNGVSLYSEAKDDIKNVRYKVPKSGTYKIEVEDTSGNIYSESVKIHVDVTYPQIQNITVTNDSKVSDNTKYCKAKVGDTVTVTMTAHENISSYGDIYLNGKKCSVKDAKINEKTLIFKIQLTQEVVNECGLDGYINIEVKDLKDKFNNTGSYSNKEALYLDKVAPEIVKLEITGGKRSKDNEVIEIYKDHKIHIEVSTSERLSDNLIIDLSGYRTVAKYTKDVKINEKNCSQYTVTIDTNKLIDSFKTKGIENSFIPVEISNYYDLVGNEGETIIIDENNKSTNDLCLVYGKGITGELYFSGVGAFENATEDEKDNIKAALGDINADEIINSYDYLLLTRHLSKIEELDAQQEKFANADGKNSIDNKDLVALNALIEERKNELFKDVLVTLKVYNKDNTEITADKLKELSIVQGSDLVELTKDNKIQIKANGKSGEVIIKAIYEDETGYGQQVGEMKFIIGTVNQGTAGFEVINNNTDVKVIGDVNSDGFATIVDSLLIGYKLVNTIEFNEEQMLLADVLEDGRVTVQDRTAIEKQNYYNYRGLLKGDEIDLKFMSFELKSYEEFKDNTISNQIVWSTKQETDGVTITPNDTDGTAKITINDKASIGEKITVVCTARTSKDVEEIAEFNLEVIDQIKVDITNKEIHYDMSNLPEKNTVLKATTNVINRKITWSTSDENIAKVQVDEFGNAEVIPVKTGKAEIIATVDGVSAKCIVNINELINTITVDKQEIEIKERQEEEINVTVNPTTATESVIIISEDEKIAKVYKDETTGKYKVLGVAEGTTNIKVTGSINTEVKQTIKVNVKKITTPTLKTVSIDQEEEEKIYVAGNKMEIKFIFTDKIKGEAPILNIKFGEYKSVGETKFIGFEDNNTAIAYEYTVQEGDNGILRIETLEGGTLTDETGKEEAILTLPVNIDEIPGDREIENSDINQQVSVSNDSIENVAINEEEEDIETEVIPTGIYKNVSAVIADTMKPTITIIGTTDKDSHWLRTGDVAQVKITASEELSQAPTVTIGGIETQVSGKGKEFSTSLKLTEEVEEGYLEIKVSGYKDIAGNEGIEVVAKEENIDEPFIVDNSGTTIKSVELITEKGKEYKAGDKFDIKVTFKDATMNRNEYIGSSEEPTIKIKFKDKDAQGKFESDYKAGEYVDSIVYTYTISEKDDGKISFEGISGTISDVAGNETDLSTIEELPEMQSVTISKEETNNDGSDNDEQNNNNQNNNNSNDNTSNKKDDTQDDGKKNSGKLPFTGASVVKTMLIALGTVGIIGLYIMKKKKLRLRIIIK